MQLSEPTPRVSDSVVLNKLKDLNLCQIILMSSQVVQGAVHPGSSLWNPSFDSQYMGMWLLSKANLNFVERGWVMSHYVVHIHVAHCRNL